MRHSSHQTTPISFCFLQSWGKEWGVRTIKMSSVVFHIKRSQVRCLDCPPAELLYSTHVGQWGDPGAGTEMQEVIYIRMVMDTPRGGVGKNGKLPFLISFLQSIKGVWKSPHNFCLTTNIIYCSNSLFQMAPLFAFTSLLTKVFTALHRVNYLEKVDLLEEKLSQHRKRTEFI